MGQAREVRMKPLAYLRDRPVPVLALAMAYSRVVGRRRSSTYVGAIGISKFRQPKAVKRRVSTSIVDSLQPKLWMENEETK